MAGRAGVAGRLCLGVAKVDRLKAGVREVEDAYVPGSENRTLFDRVVQGVFATFKVSEARLFSGENITLARRFGFLKAIGMSLSVLEAMAFMLMLLQRAKIFRLRIVLPDRCPSHRLSQALLLPTT